MFPLDWQQSTVADGEFTVESDRFIVVKLAEAAVEDKIRQLGQTGPLRLGECFSAHSEPDLHKQQAEGF